MSTCSMRAERFDGKGYFSFSLDDAPCYLGENMLVLLRRRMTPILKMNTIELCSDLNTHVNDIVRRAGEEELWIVQYDAGFIAINLVSGERRDLHELRPFAKVRRATEQERQDFSINVLKLRYKYKDHEFELEDIIGYRDGKLLVRRVPELVHPLEIVQDMGFTINEQTVFLGEPYRDYSTVMCYGRVCVQTKLGAMDIQTKKYFVLGGI